MHHCFLVFTQSILLLFFNSILVAQNFGGNSFNQKWKQIKTDSFRIIFTEEVEDEANRAGSLIEIILQQRTKSVGKKCRFTNIVFQNKTTIPNGYVSYAPLKSEFFCTPPPSPYSLGAISWMDGLTIHEYRHVLQLSNTRQGITKILAILFGDYAWAAASNVNIPNWYYEGDAVMAETAFTEGGRGRTPIFSLTQRALLSNNINYSFQKARNGSLKSLVPSHYPFGYVQINYARNKFGIDIWKKIVSDASKYKGIFYPFSRNLKKHTGLTTKKLYEAAYDSIKQDHLNKFTNLKLTKTTEIKANANKETPTNYFYPFINQKGKIYCLKNSFKETTKIIEIDSLGREKNIVSLGIGDNGYFSFRNNKFAWTERRYDPRWANQNYSIIVTYDRETKKRKPITKKTKFFSPEFSNDGKKIVVVESLPNQKYSLKILNAISGEIITSLPNSQNYFFCTPKWSRENKNIITIAQNTEGEFALISINITSGQLSPLINFTKHILASPFITKDFVYFSSSLNKVDNLYRVDLKTLNIYQITSVKLGAYFPSSSNSTLLFSEFDHLGYYLSKIDLNKLNPIKINGFQKSDQYNSPSLITEGGSILKIVPQKKFEVKKYRKLSHPINIHSWYPLIDANYLEYSIVSENILNTLQGSATYRFNRNDNSSSIIGNITYGGFYPILSAGVNHIMSRNMFYQNDNSIDTIRWNETQYNLGIKIPLNISKGLYTTKVTVESRASEHIIKYNENPNKQLLSLNSNLTASNLRRKAKQNINPRFGQIININLKKGLDYNIWEYSLSATLLFPGFFKNHSLYINAAFKERKLTKDYIFSNQFYYARGYSAIRLYADIFKSSINYQLPLIYPDLGFIGIVYFKRIRSNFFVDYSIINKIKNSNIREFNSYGLELFFDTQLLNLFPLSFGVRESILLNQDPNFPNRKHYPSLILNIDF